MHPGITILCNRWRLPGRVYQRLLPFIHAPHLRTADIFKTNQTNGAEIAEGGKALAETAHCTLRRDACLSHARQRTGEGSVETLRAREIERRSFTAAQQICAVVTTPAMAADITQRIPGLQRKATLF